MGLMYDHSVRAGTTLCGPRVLARLHELTGEAVVVMTLRMRYGGRLLAVHPRAVWLEISEDCRMAITEPVVSVAPLSDETATPRGCVEQRAHPAGSHSVAQEPAAHPGFAHEIVRA